MRRLFPCVFFAIPIVAVLFFVTSAFMFGNPGFITDKTQKGLLISKIVTPVNPVELNDLIVSAHGLSYHEILGFFLMFPPVGKPGTITVLRGTERIDFSLKTIPFSPLSLFETIWVRLMLIFVFLTLGLIALCKAPQGPLPVLFFLMLCSMSISLAGTIPSSIAFLSPITFSAAFLLHTFFNWIFFGLWLHFALRFPATRDMVRGRWWIPLCIYSLPAATTIGGALCAAGATPEFWGWVQRLKNLYLPFIIIGVFVKHMVDYKLIQNRQERNKIKMPLIAYWLTAAPYLIFYLLPNLLTDTPLISFRTAVFAFFILPMAYLAGILRYQLFDVDQIISRTIAYFVIIVGLSILYSLLFTNFEKWFFGDQVISKEIFLLFLILANIVFHPVISKLDHLIRKFFFKQEPFPIKTMLQLSNMISTTLYLPDLVRIVIEALPKATNIKSAAIMIFEKNRPRLFPDHLSFGEISWTKSRLVKLFKNQPVAYLSTDHAAEDTGLEKELKEIQKSGFSLVLPLKGPEFLSALLFIGPKKGGGGYQDEDIHLLASFANQATIALRNTIQHESLMESKRQLEDMFDQKVQSEKMATIGEMTSILAHELKNPLGIIHSSAQYLLEGKQSKKVSREMLHYIKNEVEHLNLSINSILKLARQKTPEFKKVDLANRVCQLMDQWCRSEDHRSDIKINVIVIEPLSPVYADFRQLSQVLLNLVRNSEEMMDCGGKITLEVKQACSITRFRVIDNGPGIPEKDLDKVFQNFFTTKKQGLGLGLGVCKQIIKAHNGTISLENITLKGRKGSVACIRLPINPLSVSSQYGKETVSQNNPLEIIHET